MRGHWLVVIALMCAIPASAQINPADMRSGRTDFPSNGLQTLFTVPAGQRFVLTDVRCDGPNAIVRIREDGVTDRWYCARALESSTTAYVRESWVTGLVFEAGHTVDAVVNTSPTQPAVVFWSGYVAPITTAAVPDDASRQLGFRVAPNPSRQALTLRFQLRRAADVRLSIYDPQGRRIKQIVRERLMAGTHVRSWDGAADDGSSVAPGMYFAKLESSAANSVLRFARVQ
jgi:hypothetical protein